MSEKKLRALRIFFLVLFFFQIFYIYQFRSGFNFKILKNPFSQDSGIEFSLPPQVIESKKLIKKNKIDNFNLSDGIKNNEAMYQRIIEFNYPIRFKTEENIYLFLAKENFSEKCEMLEKGEYLYLGKC
jgi:hypothetical protein